MMGNIRWLPRPLSHALRGCARSPVAGCTQAASASLWTGSDVFQQPVAWRNGSTLTVRLAPICSSLRQKIFELFLYSWTRITVSFGVITVIKETIMMTLLQVFTKIKCANTNYNVVIEQEYQSTAVAMAIMTSKNTDIIVHRHPFSPMKPTS